MEVADRQEVSLPLGKPGARGGSLAFGAVPVAAAVVGNAPVPAVFAGLDMSPQCSGAAMLDPRHHLGLGEAQMSGMGGPVGSAGSTDDVGDLKRGGHASAIGCVVSDCEDTELVERTDDSTHCKCRDLGKEGGVLQLGMPEQDLDHPDIDAVLQQMGGEAVAQSVRAGQNNLAIPITACNSRPRSWQCVLIRLSASHQM